jgi:MFS family permease
MDPARDRRDGTLAVVLGAVLFLSVATLALFFVVGGPFGTINDWTIGLAGLLTGLLLVVREGREDVPAPAGGIAVAIGVLGAVLVVAGAGLVITRTTGFFLAGLVETVGFALVGVWLLVLSAAARRSPRWPRGLAVLGITTGVVMALGFVASPGVVSGIDDMNTAPWWIWVAFVAWLGIFVLYPIWCLWYGTALRTRAAIAAGAP